MDSDLAWVNGMSGR